MKNIIALAALVALTGCASVMNETTHPMKLETKTAAGAAVTGAECTLTNDYGVQKAKSGETINVRRSNKDLDIVCKDAANPDANARAISRTNTGMWGNIIIGGGIGAIIDHNKGTAYTYPTWIQMIFGQSLVFDRSNEKEGSPVPAGIKGQAATASNTAAPAANTASAAAPAPVAAPVPAAKPASTQAAEKVEIRN